MTLSFSNTVTLLLARGDIITHTIPKSLGQTRIRLLISNQGNFRSDDTEKVASSKISNMVTPSWPEDTFLIVLFTFARTCRSSSGLWIAINLIHWFYFIPASQSIRNSLTNTMYGILGSFTKCPTLHHYLQVPLEFHLVCTDISIAPAVAFYLLCFRYVRTNTKHQWMAHDNFL